MAKVAPNIAALAARSPDVQDGLQELAEDVAARARTIATTHSDTGTYADSWEVSRGRIDRYISSTDPAAVSKEYGRTGASGKGTSRGIYALTRAVEGEG